MLTRYAVTPLSIDLPSRINHATSTASSARKNALNTDPHKTRNRHSGSSAKNYPSQYLGEGVVIIPVFGENFLVKSRKHLHKVIKASVRRIRNAPKSQASEQPKPEAPKGPTNNKRHVNENHSQDIRMTEEGIQVTNPTPRMPPFK